MAPASLEEALALRAEHGDATVLAGGTFVGILMNQGFLAPSALLSLGGVDELRGDRGARTASCGWARWSGTARSSGPRSCARAGRRWRTRSRWWPARACATRRPSAACWPTPTTPPTRRRCSPRSNARAVLRGPRGDRSVAVGELILGHYRTCIEPDELLVEVRVPPQPERADVPQVPLALGRGPAVRGGGGGARRTACAWWSARWRARRRTSRTCATASRPRWPPRYAERIEPMSDARGSADVPAARDRRGGAARGGGGRRGPARDRRPALLVRRRAARHAARRLRALARTRTRACSRSTARTTSSCSRRTTSRT